MESQRVFAPEEKAGAVEAVLYASGEAVPVESLCQLLEMTAPEMDRLLDDMTADYDANRRGMMLMRYQQLVQLCTRPCYEDAVRVMLNPPARVSLTQPALETLSIIAYQQPITRASVEGLRGVKCDYVISVLVARKLIHEVGRSNTLGRAILYGTTDHFLQHFGLASLQDLPQKHLLAERLARIDADLASSQQEFILEEPPHEIE